MKQYTIREDKDISGTWRRKSSLIVKLEEGITKAEIIKSAKEIIYNKKNDNEYVLILMSTNDNVLSRDVYGWDCIAQWKQINSDFDISRKSNNNMEQIEGIYFEFNK